jgi:hypothetical protein
MLLGTSASGMDAAGWLLMISLWGAFLAMVLWAITRLFPSAGPMSDQTAQLSEPVAIGDVEWDRAANVPTVRADAAHG